MLVDGVASSSERPLYIRVRNIRIRAQRFRAAARSSEAQGPIYIYGCARPVVRANRPR
jgi:hypothetical protein